MSDRDYDIVLFGASGFVGKLTADYLAGKPKKWAIAGRNKDKLAQLGCNVPIEVVDAMDRAACDRIARRAKVIATTVGPYAKYGSALVAACAEAGTHYADLTGEVPWMRRMIDEHHARAKQTGARIVHTCGFDSIPSDLGTWATQQEFIARFGHPAAKITSLFQMSGGVSGGTAASAFEIAEASSDREVRRLLRDPHALDPVRGEIASEPQGVPLGRQRDVKMFTAPFVMADTNTPVVYRGHALAGFPWGRDFEYREMMGTKSLVTALGITAGLGALAAAMKRPRLRAWLRTKAPQPGEGPSQQQRERGRWRVQLVAERGSDKLVYVAADPAGDPGYQSTAKMLGESALCLAYDDLHSDGGVLTPSVGMGGALVERLRAIGLQFSPG